jgi:hypothetical protein
MNRKLLYALFITPLFVLAFYNTAYSYKNAAPAQQTGGINEPSCGSSTTSCHFSSNCGANGISTLGELNYDISLSANGIQLDANFYYTPETVYDMVFTINRPTARNGFSLMAVDLNDNYVGSLSVPLGSEAVINSSNSNYVGHTNTLGVSEWFFKWQAPAVNTGNVKFYASANKGSNGTGSVEGGNVTPCSDTIIPVVFEIKEFEEQDTILGINMLSLLKDMAVLNNPILNNQVVIETIVKQPKTYFISIFDLSGKRIAYQEQTLHTGIKTLEISLEQKGIFIMNISTNKNETANYKILN